MFERVHVLIARNTLPPRTVGELLESLDRLTPRFVDAVRALLDDRDDASDRGAVPAASALPELTDEQIDSLPPRGPADVPQLRAMDPAERVRVLGHTDLGNAVWAFLMTVCEDGDLLSV